ncbi:hypothetical protein KFE25_012222 [Diacronema lutheri]|uniref:Ribosomal RNA-processing protein 43 n=1 Tax=Diacronema lutheri TaxID=2081491 RepID=A0A8J5XEN5_DIALT|nr:hypothetical protein KFE25_012222 [Diacronema lutheri]
MARHVIPATTTPLVIPPEAMARLSPAEYHARFLEAEIRPDGRRLDQPRAATLALGAVRSAAGSASVRIGGTFVLAGVTCEAVALAADAAESEGELIFRLEAPAISGLRARVPGVPSACDGADAVLQATLSRSRVLAPGALRIGARGAAWRLVVDVYCLDHDGNLADAALLAAVAALAHTHLPPARLDANARTVLVGAHAGPAPEAAGPSGPAGSAGGALAFASRPVPLSFARVLGRTLADPCRDEEALADGKAGALVTVVVDAELRVAGVHKPGGAPLPDAELRACVDAARARAPALHALLDDALALAAGATAAGAHL